MEKMSQRGAAVPIPVDVVCGKKFDANEPAVKKGADSVVSVDMIFVIGEKSADVLVTIF